MRATNSLLRWFQIGAIASLVLAGLCIFAPIEPEMSNELKWVYIVIIFTAFLSVVHLYPVKQELVSIYKVLFPFVTYGLGHWALIISLILGFESKILVTNIIWLVLFYFTMHGFDVFFRKAVSNFEQAMPRTCFVLRNTFPIISIIVLIVMPIALIAKFPLIFVFCQVAVLIILGMDFLFAHNTLKKIIEQENSNNFTNEPTRGVISLYVFGVLIWLCVGYFSSRTDLEGTFYRYYPETQIIEKNEYVVFKGDNIKWYVNGEKTKDFKYDVYNGNRIKIGFGFGDTNTLSFSKSEDKNIVIIDGKEFRK